MKFGILLHPTRKQAFIEARTFIEKLQSKGHSILTEFRSAEALGTMNGIAIEHLSEQVDIIVTFGGDGTLLHAAQYANQKPILGVNLGRMGFLAEFSHTEIQSIIPTIEKNEFSIYHRSTLEISVANSQSTNTYKALNDIVVEKEHKSKMMFASVNVNQKFISTYKADGIIIATPTGSTAYSLSAGGPIIEPNTNVILITPISPHMLTIRPIVIRDDSEIQIELSNKEHSILVCDGNAVQSISSKEIITIKKSPYIVNLIRNPEKHYYEALRSKLHWGQES